MKNRMYTGIFILIMLVTACTTGDEQAVFDISSIAEEARENAAIAMDATQTTIANQPTPTIEPTATIEPTDIVEATSDDTVADDTTTETDDVVATSADEALVAAVAAADPINGEMIFSFMAAPACSTCHFADTESMLVGPGQYNLFNRTVERIENGIISDSDPYTYIYQSIINPGDHITEGYANAMPDVYENTLAEQQIYDLMAYLISLGD